MKLNITTTETRQSEIVIGFPTFTKIVSGIKTEYFAVLSEKKVIQVVDYGDNIIGGLHQRTSTNEAFSSGFEMIESSEFENAINKVNLNTHKFTSNVLTEIQTLQFDNLSIAERMAIPNNTITTDEDLQDKKRTEFVEYADIERENKEVETN